jgi:pectinesterase
VTVRLLLLALMLPAFAGGTVDLRPGGGTTLQAAIDAIPDGRSSTYTIRLAPGVYREKIHVPARKPPIRVTGDRAVITWSDGATTPDAAGHPLGTFRSATMTVEAAGFSAEGITVENTFGTGSQAVALRVSGDRCTFRRVALLGWQDTLLVEKQRQYFEDCTITGHVDFIFGGATAWFERCTVTCRGNGYITAASTPESSPHGLVFHRCRILAERKRRGCSWAALGRTARPRCS